jgi:DNA-binding MarR family transcriptional regulator
MSPDFGNRGEKSADELLNCGQSSYKNHSILTGLANIHVSTYKMRMTNKKSRLAGEIGKKGAFANLQQEAFLNLMRTQALLSSEFKQKLFKPEGLSHEKYNVLRILAGEKRPMQIYEIAERMIAPKTDISRLIERLVTTELISRQRCDQDGRVVWIKLTSKGKTVLKKLAKPVDQLHAAQFDALSRKELETFNRLLVKARENKS